MNDGNLNQVVVTEDDHMEDHDFDIEEDNEDGEQLIIEIINEVYTYPCCPNEGILFFSDRAYLSLCHCPKVGIVRCVDKTLIWAIS